VEQVEVSVEELLGGLKRRGMPLPFEIGAFIALEACEQLLDRPARIDARDIGIGDIGEVVLESNKGPASEESAVRALMVLLSELLVCSAPGVPSMLLELVESGPSGGEWTLDRLRDDLEACLVPLNRGATRRVLARLVREARKDAERSTARASIVPEVSEIDAQFDALMGQGDDTGAAAVGGKPASRSRVPTSQDGASGIAVAGGRATSQPTPVGQSSPAPRGSFGGQDDNTTEFQRGAAARSGQASSLQALRTASAIDHESSIDDFARRAPDPEDDGIELRSSSGRLPAAEGGRAVAPRAPRASSRDAHAEPASDDRQPRSERVQDSARPRLSDLESQIRSDREPARRGPTRGEERARERSSSRARPEPAPGAPARPPRPVPSEDPDDLLAGVPDRERSRWPAILGGLLVLAAAGLIGAYLALGQAGARRVLGLAPLSDEPPLAAAKAATPARAAGELRVSSTPSRAQVFLFVGEGPATATDLAIGVAQEFVALAEGHAPTRAVVPADAQWDDASPQKRYELAMQTPKLTGADRTNDLGETLLTRQVGAPTGDLGSVRIVTTPRGARVYQLIGFTPDVHVENLPLEQPYEVLVFLPGHGLETRRVEPAAFKEVSGHRVAELDVLLRRTPR
jgi:hypothetical protein